MIQEKISEAQSRIEAACRRVGRNPAEVTLIAVSKTKPVELLREAYEAGMHEFGENKPQEIREKYPQLPADIRWHMIGHLQRNKVRSIIDKVCLIHSVDSVRLAETISEEAARIGIVMPVLAEVNVAGEESKFGLRPEETEEFVRTIAKLSNICVEGLMTIAPFTENPEDNRIYFRKLKKLCVDISEKNIDNVCMRSLSMGMTGDYEVAVEEGATMVRIGTGIFGERNYTQL